MGVTERQADGGRYLEAQAQMGVTERQADRGRFSPPAAATLLWKPGLRGPPCNGWSIMALSPPPGAVTHWTEPMLAKAAGVSLRAGNR